MRTVTDWGFLQSNMKVGTSLELSQNATAELKHSLLMNVNSLDVELRIQLQLAMIEKRLSQAQQGSLLLPIQGKGDEENNIHWESEPSVQNMTHSQKPKLFGCSFCNRKFEHSGKLHRHMRIHTGERPHECEVCGKTFIQSGQLVIHKRSHTGERPYVCTVCHKGFSCSKQLKVHMRTHTKEKPYCCDICGKSFGYNHVLKLHQMAHFAEKIYKCTLCDSTFTTKKHLEQHIKCHESGLSQSAHPGHTAGAPQSVQPPSAHHSPVISGYLRPHSRFILPSIHSICPDQPQDLTKRIAPVRQSSLPPVTMEMIKSLLEEDLATYGPPSPLHQLPLSSSIYGDCLLDPLTPPPSISPPNSMSSMSEETLPLRKRRHLLSEGSDGERERSACSSPGKTRYSVICYANNS